MRMMKYEVASFIARHDKMLGGVLLNGIDINEYVDKIFDNATLNIVYNKRICGLVAYYCNDFKSLVAYVTMIIAEQPLASGRNLLNVVISDTKHRGFKVLRLQVHSSNSKAVMFYKKMGFITVNTEGSSNLTTMQLYL